MLLRSGKIIKNLNIINNNYFTVATTKIDINSYILNLTTHEYFIASSKDFYMDRMTELTTVPEKSLINHDKGESHWRKTDKIIIVPKHLNKFVERNSAELFLEYRLNN